MGMAACPREAFPSSLSVRDPPPLGLAGAFPGLCLSPPEMFATFGESLGKKKVICRQTCLFRK